MAIDTNNEKLALITFLQPWNTPVPISADGIGQDDKQHLLAGYPGILWSEGGGGGDDDTAVMVTREGMIDHSWIDLIKK